MGKTFGGRYEVLEQIGAGGMAIVYKAKDLLLNRTVTIKVLREQFLSDEEFIRRFRREAQSAASLSHPNIVSVYDVGKEGDFEYIVMEYVEGRNLKEIIREYAPLTTEQTINLGRQITEAIQNAHENHIIHRDIKPHNILVTADGHAKVTDFGIARAVSSATVTHTGDIVGSVHYLSPEQAKGLQINEQSDIYSLGIILYELVTGKVPYEGETPITIVLKHMNDQPVLPSKINPRVEKEFEAVIMRAIAKSPENRYLSAKDLLADLNNIQAGRPIAKGEIPFDEDMEATQTHIGMGKMLAPVQIKDDFDKKDKESSPLKNGNKKRWQKIAGVLILLLFVSLGGGFALKNYIAGELTIVPNVIGKTVSEAEQAMKQAKLGIDSTTLTFSDDFKNGQIVSQEPLAGDTVKVNRIIKVVVSKGPELAKFPNVMTGQISKENAEYLIHNAGFDINNITYDTGYSDDVAIGFVMAQNPLPDATWPKNGKIKLTISNGASLKSIYMPNVIGKTSTEAKKVLEAENKLIVRIESENSTTSSEDVVTRTIPNPGEPVQQGKEVTVFVSIGPGPLAQGIQLRVANNTD